MVLYGGQIKRLRCAVVVVDVWNVCILSARHVEAFQTKYHKYGPDVLLRRSD